MLSQNQNSFHRNMGTETRYAMLALESYEQSNGFSAMSADELFFINGGSGNQSSSCCCGSNCNCGDHYNIIVEGDNNGNINIGYGNQSGIGNGGTGSGGSGGFWGSVVSFFSGLFGK